MRAQGLRIAKGAIRPFTRRFSPRSKRKADTYNGEYDIRPFAQRQPSTPSNEIPFLSTSFVAFCSPGSQTEQPHTKTYDVVVCVSPFVPAFSFLFVLTGTVKKKIISFFLE